MESYLRVYLLEPGYRLIKKRIYRAVVSQRLRNTGIDACDWRHCQPFASILQLSAYTQLRLSFPQLALR